MAMEGDPENCTLWGVSCLQADLEDSALNPWLQADRGSEAWWAEGVCLPVLGLLGAGAHLLLLSAVARRAAWPADWPLALLSLSCLLLLPVLLLHRPPALLLGRPLLPAAALPHLLAARRGLATLVTLLFIIFVGARHLRQLEAASYSWWRPSVFCLVVAVLTGLPVLWELRVDRLPGELVAGLTNLTALGNITEEVEVLRRTELWHDPIYKNMVRHLLPLLTGQVATIWLLPIILLHSRAVGKVLAGQRKRQGAGRAPDRLLPVICLLFILLSLPGLADILIQILLLPPPPALAAVSSLSLALLLLLLPLLILGLDPALRLRVTTCRGPRQVPRRHQWFGNIPLPTEDMWRTEDL